MSRWIVVLGLSGVLGGCASPEPAPAPAPARAQADEQMQVVPLKYAVAAELAAEISKVLRGVRLVPDPRTNSLIVSAASQEDLARVLELIAKLDVEAPTAH